MPFKVDNRQRWILKGPGIDPEFRGLVRAAAERQGQGTHAWAARALGEAARAALELTAPVPAARVGDALPLVVEALGRLADGQAAADGRLGRIEALLAERRGGKPAPRRRGGPAR